MLFNSYEFLFLFLPITLAGYFLIAGRRHEPSIAWLFAASLFFYGWWNPAYVGLLVASILFNFSMGSAISRAHRTGSAARKKRLLMAAVGADLALLAYYKYANFFLDNANELLGLGWTMEAVILPLGISFFTFTQIAFLVDAYRGEVREHNFIHYGLFVTYFPHLIAGPVLHHKEMMPQFAMQKAHGLHWEALAVGLTFFVFGLFKKVGLADGVAPFASPVFDAAAAGQTLTLLDAWSGALAYTLQLYFDFSGYSDMAIGLSLMFGIRLPLNFNSPYKAGNIIDFWRRWHMTLSRFLRDYLYFALGGNRKGTRRRYFNLMATMLLGGLWHGAGWTFVIWGGLHGLYLCINHGWVSLRRRVCGNRAAGRTERAAGWLLTFVAVVVGWVFFRAADVDAALAMLQGMLGLNGVALPNAIAARLGSAWPTLVDLGFTSYLGGGSQFVLAWLWVLLLLMIVLALPNTQQIIRRFEPASRADDAGARGEAGVGHRGLAWAPSPTWAVAVGLMAASGVLAMNSVSEFLYFQF